MKKRLGFNKYILNLATRKIDDYLFKFYKMTSQRGRVCGQLLKRSITDVQLSICLTTYKITGPDTMAVD